MATPSAPLGGFAAPVCGSCCVEGAGLGFEATAACAAARALSTSLIPVALAREITISSSSGWLAASTAVAVLALEAPPTLG